MHRRPYHVLVAEDHGPKRQEIVSVLRRREYSVVASASPAEVADTLRRWPVDLLITGSRLGSWYGLQIILTSRASQPDLAAIIVSDGDAQSQQLDAGRHHVAVADRPLMPEAFLALVAERLAAINRRQRWPRKPVTSYVGVFVSGLPGRLVDVSYGGCRLAIESIQDVLPPTVLMSFPEPPIEVGAELIWSALGADGASCVAGVSVTSDLEWEPLWREFVDQIQ
jgi:CheY-like chemotaxis protein